MGTEQRSEKMSKKPKKDTSRPNQSPPSDRPTPPVTSVIPRGNEKTSLSEPLRWGQPTCTQAYLQSRRRSVQRHAQGDAGSRLLAVPAQLGVKQPAAHQHAFLAAPR
jgi:hypothetical protein